MGIPAHAFAEVPCHQQIGTRRAMTRGDLGYAQPVTLLARSCAELNLFALPGEFSDRTSGRSIDWSTCCRDGVNSGYGRSKYHDEGAGKGYND